MYKIFEYIGIFLRITYVYRNMIDYWVWLSSKYTFRHLQW